MIDRRSLLAVGGVLAATGAAARTTDRRANPDRLRFDRHRFGVNYVPSKHWYYCWNDWDAAAIARDLDAIAGLSADHIRVMLVWPAFQPNPNYVSSAHLDRLEQLMTLAAQHGLDVLVTPLTGWLSGFAFRPPFLEDEAFYTSPKWLEAQLFFIRTLGTRLRTHANFLGFDVGNEINCAWSAKTTAEGDAWLKPIFAAMHAAAPGLPHVNGVDHQPWFKDTTFSPQALCHEQKIVAIHSWSFWTGAGKYGGPLDQPYTRLPAAMAALVRAYAGDVKKPIWLEEFGACDQEMPSRDVARWMEIAVASAVAEGVSWFTWWASHDVPRNLDFHPFEYDLGLLDVNNRIKPRGEMFRHLARRHAGTAVVFPERIAPSPTTRDDETTWQWLRAWMRDHPAVG